MLATGLRNLQGFARRGFLFRTEKTSFFPGFLALAKLAQTVSLMMKYQAWHDRIIDAARCREMPACYSELHHIKPRSLGGSDDISNLVRLTYREHFLVHWLLTKICTGRDLHAMQKALSAMTMPVGDERIVSGWRFEVAKRAIRDLQDSPDTQVVWRRNYLLSKQEKASIAERDALRRFEERALLRESVAAEAAKARPDDNLNQIADRFLRAHRRGRAKFVPITETTKRKRAERAAKAHAAAFPDVFHQTAATKM